MEDVESSELEELDPLEPTAELPDVPISPVADEPTPGLLVLPPEALLPPGLVLLDELLPLSEEPALPEALAPWFAPLDWPVELLPELDPERLVPELEPDWPLADDPDELG